MPIKQRGVTPTFFLCMSMWPMTTKALHCVMRFVINITVAEAESGMPLVEWLCYHLIDENRSSVMRAIRAGRVAVNREAVKDPDYRLSPGVEVGFQEAGEDPDSAEPWTPLPGFRVAMSEEEA